MKRVLTAAAIVRRQLRVNNAVVTVVGVAPRGFIGLNGLVGPDLRVPVRIAQQRYFSERCSWSPSDERSRAAVDDKWHCIVNG